MCVTWLNSDGRLGVAIVGSGSSDEEGDEGELEGFRKY